MSNYLIHYGVKGSKWGFNKGKRNGKQVAQYEYDSQGNLMEKGLINSIKARNGYQRPPMMGTNARKVTPKSRVELASRKVLSEAKKSYGLHDGKTMTVDERRSYGLHNGPTRTITGGRGVGERRVGSSGVRKAVNANSARKWAKSISNKKFSESIKDLKKMGNRAARKQKVENWLTKSKIGSSAARKVTPKMGTKARKVTPKMGTKARKVSPKMGTKARKATPTMGMNARKVTPKSRKELAARKFKSDAFKKGKYTVLTVN